MQKETIGTLENFIGSSKFNSKEFVSVNVSIGKNDIGKTGFLKLPYSAVKTNDEVLMLMTKAGNQNYFATLDYFVSTLIPLIMNGFSEKFIVSIFSDSNFIRFATDTEYSSQSVIILNKWMLAGLIQISIPIISFRYRIF